LLSTEDGARGVMNSLVASVATTWFELRELDDEVQIITDTIKSQEESLALVQSLNRSGRASGTEEQQAARAARNDASQLPAPSSDAEQTENALRFLLGDPPRQDPAHPSPRNFRRADTIPVGLPSQLLARRPDLAPGGERAARGDRTDRRRDWIAIPVPEHR
jgi:multidrug efflux system outer membrane protein